MSNRRIEVIEFGNLAISSQESNEYKEKLC